MSLLLQNKIKTEVIRNPSVTVIINIVNESPNKILLTYIIFIIVNLN
jgi:hypothetical protein